MPSKTETWPELPYAAWKDTCATLQLWTQIVGKIRLAQTPWLNHSWHVTLYVTRARADHVADSVWRRAPSRSTSTFIDHVLWSAHQRRRHFRQVVLRAACRSPISMPT